MLFYKYQNLLFTIASWSTFYITASLLPAAMTVHYLYGHVIYDTVIPTLFSTVKCTLSSNEHYVKIDSSAKTKIQYSQKSCSKNIIPSQGDAKVSLTRAEKWDEIYWER